MNLQRITVEINKLPSTRRNANLFDGDTVARALADVFGDSEDYSTYSISVNGGQASLNTQLHEGDVVALAKQTKGNTDETVAEEASVEVECTPETCDAVAEEVEAVEAEVESTNEENAE